MDATPANTVETPSGKDSGGENFPVGSFLLPKRLRPQVATFYAYARAIDDIADNPELAPEEKVSRLDGFDRALIGETDDPAFEKALRVRETLSDVGETIRHCRDLIIAFKRDATKLRYDDWDDLMDYCNHSAAPVGRFLLDLHECPNTAYPASDALCNALQVINHLQDCGEDRRDLDRVYLPQDWMAQNSASVEELDNNVLNPGLRRVIDLCLDGTEALLRQSRRLPPELTSRRLSMEAAAIQRLAERLCRRLRREDPLASRVKMGKPAFLWFAGLGVLRYWMGR